MLGIFLGAEPIAVNKTNKCITHQVVDARKKNQAGQRMKNDKI